MATKITNPFLLLFSNSEVKTAEVKALNGAVIQYRDLTLAESDSLQKKLIKEIDVNGKPVIDFNAMTDNKYEKISLCLIDPKMTVDELKSLNSNAIDALNEIDNLISGSIDEVMSEGNLKPSA